MVRFLSIGRKLRCTRERGPMMRNEQMFSQIDFHENKSSSNFFRLRDANINQFLWKNSLYLLYVHRFDFRSNLPTTRSSTFHSDCLSFNRSIFSTISIDSKHFEISKLFFGVFRRYSIDHNNFYPYSNINSSSCLRSTLVIDRINLFYNHNESFDWIW